MRRVVGDADGSAGTCVKARCRWSFGLRLRLSAGLRSAPTAGQEVKKKKNLAAVRTKERLRLHGKTEQVASLRLT